MIMTKLVRMTAQEYDCVSKGLETLQAIAEQLEEMPESETDEEIRSLWDYANSAYGAVWDFMSAYRDQFKA